MTNWFGFAIAAALLYGLHQIFTKLASEHVSDGLGALIVEASAVVTIAVYLGALYASGRWMQRATAAGTVYSAITGICVGVGTIMFFLLFQRGGPLSAVPAILAGGAALMALAGLVLFREPATPMRLAGVCLALIGLYLVR
jgi:bacterial/archaeal transporter family protein